MAGKIILVTGANRGIGFPGNCMSPAILATIGTDTVIQVQALAQRSQDLTLLVSARQKADSQNAIKQLQELGLKARFHPAELDVSIDSSIEAAVSDIWHRFGKLDVLINNSGIAGAPLAEDTSNFRQVYNQIYDVNVTSVAMVSTLFLPLLRKAEDPRVINVSSARGSLTLVTTGQNPATSKIPYSISKAALNLLTVEMGNANPDIEFQSVNPGWCKTGFNGFRGLKDPLEGGLSAVELALAGKGRYEAGFWEYEDGEMRRVPW